MYMFKYLKPKQLRLKGIFNYGTLSHYLAIPRVLQQNQSIQNPIKKWVSLEEMQPASYHNEAKRRKCYFIGWSFFALTDMQKLILMLH